MSYAHQTDVGTPAQYTPEYHRYEALRWIDVGASPQPSNPIYRPQPRYRPYLRTLSPQPLQKLIGRIRAPAYPSRLMSRTPPDRPLTRGNNLMDFRAPPSAPIVITAGKFWNAMRAGTNSDSTLDYERAVGGPYHA